MSTAKPYEFFVQWHLTENCNLRCRHCYQGEPGREEMPLSVIRDAAGEIADTIRDWSDAYGMEFSPSMNITGGEPLLRRDLFDILEEVKRRGFAVSLLTNGTLVSRARARRLADLGVECVQVSIEGSEDVHDDIRGSGSFGAAAAGIERLVDCGVPVTINVTLSALNAASLKKVVAFGSHSGVERIGFSRLVPYGRGSGLLSRMLSPEEVKDLYESIFSLELNGVTVVTGDPVASQMKMKPAHDAGAVPMSGCAAGLSGLTILPNGNVMPCRRLPLSLGNVSRHSLRELWAASPVLEALRDRTRYRGRCGRCKRWAQCRGCRAIAYAWARAHGRDDFLADDPQCFIEV